VQVVRPLTQRKGAVHGEIHDNRRPTVFTVDPDVDPAPAGVRVEGDPEDTVFLVIVRLDLHHLEKDLDEVRVKLGSRIPPDLLHRLLPGHSLPVRPPSSHHLISISNG